MLTLDSAWVLINLICVISNVMRGQIVKFLSLVKLIRLHSKHAKLYLFFVCQILKANYKTPPNFMKLFEET